MVVLLKFTDLEQIAEGYFLIYQYLKENNHEDTHYFLLGAHKYHSKWLVENKRQIDEKDWKQVAHWREPGEG